MRLAYPASHLASRLNTSLLSLKIARHSPCSQCDSCQGLHPPPGVDVVLDEQLSDSSLGDLEQYGSDDDDITSSYIDTCACGHDAKQHNADEHELGSSEFARRSRVAIRLDELLQDSGRLLDFEYDDDDIKSLRLQMSLRSSAKSNSPADARYSLPLSPASSILSDPPAQNKKHRISLSPLSDDEDDDEDDKPLAGRVAGSSISRAEKSRPGKRSGKKAPSKKAKKSHTAPTSLAPPVGEKQALMNGKLNGVNGHDHKIKLEEKIDEAQLSRLAATIDTGRRSPPVPPIKTEKPSAIELRKGVIQIAPVENDQQPRSLIILTGLKTLFQKQLPKMPREYIARLVLDSNSKGLAIIKRGLKVVGGICYRPFPHRGFAEIVFFATNSADQEKGYGGMLMDHFKAHIKRTYPTMMHFLTYADNFAVGYFEKQGFSKDITLDRSVWAGYIKDYEGGTIMQCTMLRKVDYLDKANIITQQQEAIMTKIRELSKSDIIYPGLPQFQPGAPDDITVDPKDVPGLRESGWTPDMARASARKGKNSDHHTMDRILRELQGHRRGWPFCKPVDTEEVPDYYDVVKNPMDFNTMERKLEDNEYDSIDSFTSDVQLVFDNCRLYNPEGSAYAKHANAMEAFFKELMADLVKTEK